MNCKKILCTVLVASMFILALSGCKGEEPDTSSVASLQLPSLPVSSENEPTETSTEPAETESTPTEETQSTNYSNYTEYTSNKDNAPDINNIILTTESSVYPRAVSEIDVNIANRTGWMIVYAETFTVEKFSGGKWVMLPFKEDAPPFKEAYPMDNNSNATLTVDLTRLKDDLDVGSYRVGIRMICNGYPGDFYRTVEFSVK